MGRWYRGARVALTSNPIGTHGLCDVLDDVLAERFEVSMEPSQDNIMHDTGHRYAAGISETFETRGNVDAVSIDGAVRFFNHIAQVDADPEQHLAMLEELCIAVRQRCLNPHGRFSGADGRLKHRQHRI